jgi:hypothetical protein
MNDYSKYNYTYREALKDPRWQKRRLEIMDRDNFTCLACGSKTETLNVHHIKYGSTPWEIDEKYLVTLCEKCHHTEEEYKRNNISLGKLSERSGLMVTKLIDFSLEICFLMDKKHGEYEKIRATLKAVSKDNNIVEWFRNG